MAHDPNDTLTLVFTDTVSSTEVADRLGDTEAQAIRRAHDRILRQQVEAFGGSVVKTAGDGFFVIFPSAHQGVGCAVAIQRSIAAEHGAGRYRELSVRIGIHTGEPVVEDDDVFGGDVNLAARIETEAVGGQVLISDVTRLLLGQSPHLRVAPVGERRLKGIHRPVPLFEVRWSEEPVPRRGVTPLFGRSDEVAYLHAHLEAAMRGEGSTVLVGGELGVGKTRLVSELAVAATDRGLTVLTGRAFETEGMPPYMPFIEAITPYVRQRQPEELRELLDESGTFLTRLLPELAAIVPLGNQPPALDPESERFRLFESVWGFLRSISGRAPVLLLLDDVHWADRSTILLMQHLARRVRDARLLLLGTYREPEVDTNHPLAALVSEIERDGLGGQLSLQPLGRERVSSLVEATLHETPSPRAVEAIFEAGQGNPLFTEELTVHLRDQGYDLIDPSADVAGWSIPDSVRQVIHKRLAVLSREAIRVLGYSSVLHQDLTLGKVSLVTGLNEDKLLDLLDQALDAGVLREEEHGYGFAHPLVQNTLYQGLSRARRETLHRRVGQALESLYESDIEAHLAELAYHFCSAAPTGAAAGKAFDYARRAGHRALAFFAYDEAARHYECALRNAEATATPAVEHCAMLIDIGHARALGGDIERAMDKFRDAAARAAAVGAPDLQAKAALGFEDVRKGVGQATKREESLGLLEQALDAIGDSEDALAARLLGQLADVIYYTSARERRQTLSDEALRIARRIDDPATLAYVLNLRHSALWGPENIADRLATARDVLALAEEIDDRNLALRGRRQLITDLLECGEIGAVDKEIDLFAQLTEELRQPLYFWFVATRRAMRALLDGRHAEAEALVLGALNLSRQWHSPEGAMIFAIQMFSLRRQQGRLAEVEAAFGALTESYPHVRWDIALSFIHAETGREEQAQAEFAEVSRKGFRDIPEDAHWLISITLLAELCASLGDASRAAPLYEMLVPYAGRNVIVGSGAACNGAAARYLGLLATTMGRFDAASGHFEDALDMNRRLGARPLVAYTRYDYARMLVARRGASDQRHAELLLDDALDTARALDMSRLAQQAEALRAGIARGAAEI